ncbi:stomatal cytokinesis defective SCD1 protein [Trifolium pratense]|uniref:Stomatal cytokinesis defective SCD1 protein n=1 Tax=Trifolium pratense TaxID=57577 RepID=A0A2K3M5K5_TRIPR|nr:stomatal cytokinesis defective SCD1 protein [Trifolium pratense]
MSLFPSSVVEPEILTVSDSAVGIWNNTCQKNLPKYDYVVGFAALIESDAEGIGGSGFVECIREHMHSGWHRQLTEEQFIAVNELIINN